LNTIYAVLGGPQSSPE